MNQSAPALLSRVGKTIFRSLDEPKNGFCKIDGQEMYRIGGFNHMAPFLMSVVSDSDLWMYLSSTGGLTAGRVSEDRSIFPYQTDDLLHHCRRVTGPLTLLRVRSLKGEPVLWEPFDTCPQAHPVERNLYKSVLGNRVTFEEIRPDLGLRFRYRWCTSDTFGFVRTCTLINDRTTPVEVDVIDGLLNILPAGVDLVLQQKSSCLINAYAQCEVDRASGMGIYSMTSLIIDKAEPAEALRANVVWSRGLESPRVLLCQDQLASFCAGDEVHSESILRGRRGSYLITDRLVLHPSETRRWDIVTDAGLDHIAVESLRQLILQPASMESRLQTGIEQSARNLLKNVASADGVQLTADPLAANHHQANVLFNNMRGGVFADNHCVTTSDLRDFIQQRNVSVANAQTAFLAGLPVKIEVTDLIASAAGQNDPDLLRLCYEYLPLTFSRRHGDPSRPWNRFAIKVKDRDGGRLLDYQGNWRDIFQNWESMLASFPAFIESVIAKFVNASTIDGFNPYRVTRWGIDWEKPEPHDPWANIGYWGDHQIIYLLRLLEMSRRFHGPQLSRLLTAPIYSYAQVPYRLKPYSALIHDRWNTIDFDRDLDRAISKRCEETGADGKLLPGKDGSIYHVTLLEKLLVTLLSKLSNLVVDGGIWMNTQRPEWNDANNALVGNGVSMVTHYHLRRYVAFVADLLEQLSESAVTISAEVHQWFEAVCNSLQENHGILKQPEVSDRDRKRVLDGVGLAFCKYRAEVYESGFSGKASLPREEIIRFLSLSLRYLDHGIAANRRADGLYHAYNLISFSPDGTQAHADNLYEMLEGQVAVLSSGALSAKESVELLESLFHSKLYRPDQQSFMLYPDRQLPGFLARNLVPAAEVKTNPLLNQLLAAENRAILAQDAAGHYRFNGDFRSSRDLDAALSTLESSRWAELVKEHRQATLELFEKVFNHRAFTGRSGTMYGYEGLGCIYWHMVSKLLLAAQECHAKVLKTQDAALIERSAALYYRVRQGLSFNKTPQSYGAFPLDPYSHTPKHAGAQQPGMTGQVKEEILTRFGELGVEISDGQIGFNPRLLRRREFNSTPVELACFDVAGNPQSIPLPAESLGFTVCQTPVVYHLTDGSAMTTITWKDGSRTDHQGTILDSATSAAVLARRGEVARIEVVVPETSIRLN